jgi:hypothetical protein
MPNLHNIDSCPEHWKLQEYGGSRFCNLYHNKTYTKAESENRTAVIQGRKVCYQKKQGMDDYRMCHRLGKDGPPVLRI